VFDARGRRGLRERPGILRGPATIAIGSAVAVSPAEPAATILVPLDEGWIWFAHPGGGRAWVQATLDAADPAGRPPAERLAAAMASAAAELPRGGPCGRALVREAAPVLPPPLDNLEIIPVGDAAAAMDPLSGHGMFWAVSGALAATAVRRSLAGGRGGDAAQLALRFLNERSSDVHHRQARLGRDFIRAEQGRGELPFWGARAAFPDNLPVAASAPSFEIATRVVVENNVLREREVLLTPESPGGVCWLGNRPAVELYRAWASGMRRPAMDRMFGAAGRNFEGWLAAQGTAPGTA
ncbi:MAG TPA: pilus assembly protein CpaD, partial [Paracoccus sp. (in: a-proteobacteria)]|nr:pilus assembly protein CpaD [Paracoccus sp. (in: a-proteobacteria)]